MINLVREPRSVTGDRPQEPVVRTQVTPAPVGPVQRLHGDGAGASVLERLVVFIVAVAGYIWVGNWLVVQLHVVGFDTLEDQLRALMVWHNDPAKLSAIGWDGEPLRQLAVVPFAMFAGPVSNLTVVPIATSLFGGLLAVTVNGLLRRGEVPAVLRWVLVLAFAVNPLLVFEAATGRSTVIWVALLAAAVSSLVAWYDSAAVRHIMSAGVVLALAFLAGFTTVIWVVLAMILVAGVLGGLRARSAEVEGTLIGLAAPATYVVAVWTVLAWIATGRLGGWLPHQLGASGAVAHREVARATFELVVASSPLTLVVVPALLLVGLLRRDVVCAWLAVVVTTAVAIPAVAAWWRLTPAPLELDDGLPILVLTVVAGAWLARIGGRVLVAAGLAALLVATVPWTLNRMESYPRQHLAVAFAHAITTGESQEGVTAGGHRIGIGDELAMARQIEQLSPDRGSILTDDTATYAVMLLTGRPEWFLDRVDHGDARWQAARRDVPASVDLMLLSTEPGSVDQLTQLLPEVAAGTDARFPVVYRTERYLLVRVQPGTDLTSGPTSEESLR
ncbi:MAG TPA: hypothetical protein VNS55_14475 [Nocardioides sp.]|nr:hypothetical protein [Nocardioides sp.]